MSDLPNRILETFREINTTQLWDEQEQSPISSVDREALRGAQIDQELQNILDAECDEMIMAITLEQLMVMSFDGAKAVIERFSLAKRINTLSELDVHRSYLYSQASRYGDENPLDSDRLTTKDWNIIMSKIKHLEIIQACLYGV